MTIVVITENVIQFDDDVSTRILQSDLNTTRLYTTRTSVIRGFFQKVGTPNYFVCCVRNMLCHVRTSHNNELTA